MTKQRKFTDNKVKAKFDSYDELIKPKMLAIRELIFDTADTIEQVDEIDETLKWGEPSYATSKSRTGSPIRLDWKSATPQYYYLYFNCNTSLIDDIKTIYGDLFNYGGRRSIILDSDKTIPYEALSDCIAMALTYHLTKKVKS